MSQKHKLIICSKSIIVGIVGQSEETWTWSYRDTVKEYLLLLLELLQNTKHSEMTFDQPVCYHIRTHNTNVLALLLCAMM